MVGKYQNADDFAENYIVTNRVDCNYVTKKKQRNSHNVK